MFWCSNGAAVVVFGAALVQQWCFFFVSKVNATANIQSTYAIMSPSKATAYTSAGKARGTVNATLTSPIPYPTTSVDEKFIRRVPLRGRMWQD